MNNYDTRVCVGINFNNDLTTENTEGFIVTIAETTNFDSRYRMRHMFPLLMLTVKDYKLSLCQYCIGFSYTEAVINIATTSYTRREDVGMFEICMTVLSTTG